MSPPPRDMTADSPNLASLSLTHISYDPTDPISTISAYLSLLPLFLMTLLLTVAFTTREVESLLFLSGQFANEFFNNILKRLFRAPRPTTLRGGYGMPSSHAQFVFFFATYLALMMAVRCVGGGKALKGFGTPVYSVVTAVGAVGVAGSRVYLGYHSLNQVLVGGVIGMAFAAGWFWLGGQEELRRWAVDAGRMFWVRDGCRGVDLVEEGYYHVMGGKDKKR